MAKVPGEFHLAQQLNLNPPDGSYLLLYFKVIPEYV